MDNKEKDKLTMQLLAWQDTLAAKSQAANGGFLVRQQVEIETIDIQQTLAVSALLDSGTTGNFLDIRFVECHKLTTHQLSHATSNKARGMKSMVEAIL
ncbi:hypothetical protein DXG03_008850 [Asterophora parasitica]|uniref:Uncharacterized protein n=1 Tax=Asterophora parasitica TaxID=117018 RepID=A0A9P7G038_9AGAR|nr:hypothetical protein DXG03_008850 [Asterophora parasitica]